MYTLIKCCITLLIIMNCMAIEEEATVSTEFFILCDENSTCSTYDPDENTSLSTEDGMFINTTEAPFINETTNFTVSTTPKPEIKYDEAETDLEYCPCNIQRDYCDINCCCDTDCTVEQTLVFSDCEDTISSDYDRKYCHFVEYKYVNNTKVRFDIYENGLFCIVSSNLPAHYYIQFDKPIVSLPKAEKAISSRYKWPKIPYQTKNKFNNTLSFKYGQQIWFNYNELELIPFSLPNNFISTTCSRTTYVEFLKDIKTSCRQTVLDDNNIAINSGSYFKNITVLSLPKLLNTTLDENYLQDCPKNTCLPINVFVCDETFQICDEMHSNDSRINASCHISIFNNEQTCLFATKKVKYIFCHNGSNGLTNVDLYLYLTNLTYFLHEEHEFIQSFEVKFMWHDYENEVNFSSILSGNPGYFIGRPILFGHLNDTTKLNESIKVPKYEITRNDCDVTKNLLVLPKNVNDYCVLNNQTYVQVDFGYNLRLHCIQKIVFNKTNNNASDICICIQQQILELWQIDVTSNHTDPQKLVGMFGNSDRLVISEWIEILYKFEVRKLLDKIVGNFKDEKLFCQNIADKLRINIIFAHVDFDHAKGQAKILNTFFELEETPELKFDVIYDNVLQQHNVDVHLFMEVMFFDVTYHKIKKFVDPPTFQIKLPHDFFYPFTLGGQNKLLFNYYLVFIIIYVIL